MASFDFKYPSIAHIGKNVSHAKNRNSRAFKRNLHTVTVMVEGKKKRMRVPTKVLRVMKKSGVTTHWKKPESKD
jgi:ribosomal protein L28